MPIKTFLVKFLWIVSTNIPSVFSAPLQLTDHLPNVVIPLKIPRNGNVGCAKCSSLYLNAILKSAGGYVSGYVAQTAEQARETFKDFDIANSTSQGNSSANQSISGENQISNSVHGRRRRSIVGTVIRNNDGSVTTVRHCVDKGTVTETGNLRFCKVCSATTELPADRFPRYINEFLCTTDKTCLSGEGVCAQKSISITLLKKASTCSLTLNQYGRPYYVEDWQPYHQKISVSCECEMKPLSNFRAYMK